jgi:glyoxylase-like metal-dependent hydrolase (beta-lactamase superfamily II)
MNQANLPPSIKFIERDWLSANHIIFFDGSINQQQTTIVDTGYKKHADLTLALVRQTCGQNAKLDRIINTHLHSDHCGGNATLQREYPRVQTWIPAECAAAVAKWDSDWLTYAATGQQCDRFAFTHTYAGGAGFVLGGYDWQTIAAPGHDHTMQLLYCSQLRVLISADALWENGFGITFPELNNQSGFAEQAQTLDMIDQLDIEWVIPGHGPMFSDVKAALLRARSKLDYLRQDPARHHYLALKVLIKFLLLDQEQITFANLKEQISRAKLFNQGFAALSNASSVPLLDQIVADLVRSKAATVSGNVLFNA